MLLRTLSRTYSELDACHARLLAEGINVSNFGPNDVADDMRDLAIALHLPRVDVRVFLDGAVPTFALLRHAPGLVHAMALNSPFTAASESFDQAAMADAALRDYGRRCAADATCRSIAPRFVEMVDALRAEWSTHPRTVTVPAPDGSQVTIRLDGDRLMQTRWLALPNNGAYPFIAAAIASPNASLVAAYLALTQFANNATPNRPPDVRTIVWKCEMRPSDFAAALAADVASFPQWATLIDLDGLHHCTQWKIDAQPDLSGPIVSATPALIIRGDRQPDAESIDQLHGSLAGSQLMVIANRASGGAEGWPACVPQLRRTFMINPSRRLDIARCGRSTHTLQYATTPHALS